jgi:hypothetical protein
MSLPCLLVARNLPVSSAMASSRELDFTQCSALVGMCNFVELQATPYKTKCNWVNVLTRF